MTALITTLQILGLLLIAAIVLGFAARRSVRAQSGTRADRRDEYARHAPAERPEDGSDDRGDRR